MLPVGLMDPASNYGVVQRAPQCAGRPGPEHAARQPVRLESSGTSMAAPHITGEIALLAAQDPTRSGQRNRNLILSSGYYDYQLRLLSRTSRVMRAKLDASLGLHQPGDQGAHRAATGIRGRCTARACPSTWAYCTSSAACPTATSARMFLRTALTLTLLDNGQGADEIAGDGVYSARWTPTVAGALHRHIPGVAQQQHVHRGGRRAHQARIPGAADRSRAASYSLPIYLTVGNISGDEKPEIVATSTSHRARPTSGTATARRRTAGRFSDADGYIVARGVGYRRIGGARRRSRRAASWRSRYYGGDVYAYGPNAAVLPGWPQAHDQYARGFRSHGGRRHRRRRPRRDLCL